MKRLLLSIIVVAAVAANCLAAEKATKLPSGKQTELGLYVTAKQAYQQWKANPAGVKILDVRTPEEYIFVGHPAMAKNIPLLLVEYKWNASKTGPVMTFNEDFSAQVKEAFKPSDTILIICRSGGRSAKAVNMLSRAGFKRSFTVTDGFEGDKQRDPTSKDRGKRTVNGWKNSDIPWTYELKPELTYLPGK